MADVLFAGTSAGSSTSAGALTVTGTGRVAARSLYLYANYGVHGWPSGGEPLDGDDVLARDLYLYVNISNDRDPSDVAARSLYLYVNISNDRDPSDVAARSLYLYEAYTNAELFPWIERVVPGEQYRGGQVSIHGDGFGASQGAEGSTIRLGAYDPEIVGPGLAMGVVSWSTRSPNLYPANGDGSGANPPLTGPAIVATVPTEAVSGMLSVEETT